MFAVPIAQGHQAPDSSAFECELALGALQGLPGLQPGTGTVSLAPLVLRLPASRTEQLPVFPAL